MASNNKRAGVLRSRVNVLAYVSVPDEWGGQKMEWITATIVAANFRPLVGAEAVMASRLASKQPYIVTIRSSVATRAITPAYKLQDARAPTRMFDIKAVSDPDGKRQWLELLCVETVT